MRFDSLSYFFRAVFCYRIFFFSVPLYKRITHQNAIAKNGDVALHGQNTNMCFYYPFGVSAFRLFQYFGIFFNFRCICMGLVCRHCVLLCFLFRTIFFQKFLLISTCFRIVDTFFRRTFAHGLAFLMNNRQSKGSTSKYSPKKKTEKNAYKNNKLQ